MATRESSKGQKGKFQGLLDMKATPARVLSVTAMGQGQGRKNDIRTGRRRVLRNNHLSPKKKEEKKEKTRLTSQKGCSGRRLGAVGVNKEKAEA